MKKSLYFSVFFSGLTSLALEMTASRLLGGVFGTSNLVWASIIGLILMYLAAGYFLGGFWADRSPYQKTFYKILIWAGLSIIIIPIISKPILRMAANAFDALQLGAMFGAFLSVIILFIVPVTLLGTISPFAIRLAVNMEDAGKISGKLYAVSTLGSFFGTFLPDLFLIPSIGTYKTFLLISSIPLLIGLIGFISKSGIKSAAPYIWTPILIPALTIWGFSGSLKTTPGLIYEKESSYNYIQVLEQSDYRYLRLNEGQGIHSVYHPTQLNFSGPWQQVLVGPYFNNTPYVPDNVKRIAILGLAAGTTARQASAVYGDIPIEGYEIDPDIVDVGRTYFDMNLPNINVYVQDGRWGLKNSPYVYQIISVDAYRPPYIPWHMTTKEFFEMVSDHLSEDGVLVINVGRAPNDRKLINSLSSTLLTCFPSLYVMDIPNSFNSIIYATKNETESTNLVNNYYLLLNNPDTHPLLLEAMNVAIANLAEPPAAGMVFTDDKAPIEWITNSMVFSFILSDDMELLQ